jgi:hypothetical protein
VAKKILPLFLLMLLSCRFEDLLSDNTDQPQGSGGGHLPYVLEVQPGNTGDMPGGPDNEGHYPGFVRVTFSDYMDPASFSDSTVTLTLTTNGTQFTGSRRTYYPERRELELFCDPWPTGAEFLLRLAAGGIRNRYGAALDGNGNGTAEGAPYDDFLSTFKTYNGQGVRFAATQPPTVYTIDPDTVALNNCSPVIRIAFWQVMDESTLVNPDGTARNLTVTRVSDNTLVPIQYAGVPGQTVVALPVDSLAYGQNYLVRLQSANVRAKYPAGTPDYVKTLDADWDGAEASEPDFTWYFRVDSVTPPQVTELEAIANGVRIKFSKLMDTASITPALVLVRDDNGYVPGSMLKRQIPPQAAEETWVEWSFARPLSGWPWVRVERFVKDAKGSMLDMNGNGIGGEPGDAFEDEVP